MNIRHLRYFVALAREGHHARAAAACSVTQPTLSEAVRQLEAELGVPLIDRGGQRFRGLTAEGLRVLEWAHRILGDEDALAQELAEMKQGLAGTLRIGAIPAAMPVAPLVLTPFSQRHSLVTTRLLSMTSIEIQRGLDEFNLDVGLTYLENEPLRNVRTLPLYRERYVLLTPAGGVLDGRETVSWREAAQQPLCLLTPDMQNRRIVDRLFREGGAEPRPMIETNSILALCAHVRLGAWSSVVPHTFVTLFGGAGVPEGLQATPLIEPAASQLVGLVASDRDPLSPLARALLASARRLEMAVELERLLPGSSSIPR